MSSKTTLMGLITALMMVSVPLVYADTAAPAGQDKEEAEEHHGDHDKSFGKILNLTEDQEKQLKDLHAKQKDAMKSTFEQIKANREALESEITKATPDMNKVNDLQAQFKAIQSQMVDNHLNSILEVKKVLTPEQFAGYIALKKEREMKEHEHRGWDKEDKEHKGDKDKDND